jgi:hypothetical protein
MKKNILFISLLFTTLYGFSQTQVALNTKDSGLKFPPLDKSPLDMAYYPVDYPMQKTQSRTIMVPLVRVIYSRPQRDNRVIFGELVEYNKVWRMGANESTEIEFFKDATIAGKKLAKGRYTLYAIPTPQKWTIIINKDTDSWGAFVYDEKKDVLRTDVPVQTLVTPVDAFSMNFIKADKGTQLVIAWENASVALPIDVK